MTESEMDPHETAILEATIEHYKAQIASDSRFGLNAISQIVVYASKEFGKHPLREIQQILERKGVDAQLIAIPVDSNINRFGEAVLSEGGALSSDIRDYDVRMPHSGDENYPYWLWVTVGRPEEYRDLMERLEVTPEQNLNRLSQTGVLTVRERTELSRISSARNN